MCALFENIKLNMTLLLGTEDFNSVSCWQWPALDASQEGARIPTEGKYWAVLGTRKHITGRY